MELDLGHDPEIDDCLPSACELQAANLNQAGGIKQNILVILDSSGSMAKKLNKRTRMESAKEILLKYAKLIPSTTELAFMVYGHQGDNTEQGKALSCKGIELLASFGEINSEKFPTLLEKFNPTGWTPIADSLQAA